MNETGFQPRPSPVLHTSRVIHLTPCDAEMAFAASATSLAKSCRTPRGRFRVELPRGGAVLRPEPLSGRSRGTRGRLVGQLRSRYGWVAVPVELEVTPHSETRSELGLRPVGGICLRSSSAYRLFVRLAPALLDAIALEIEIRGVVGPSFLGLSRLTPEDSATTMAGPPGTRSDPRREDGG